MESESKEKLERLKLAIAAIGRPISVLLVDDSKEELELASEYLKKHQNVNIQTALSGMECISKIAQEQFDMVFLDVRMPGLDGLQTFKELKKLAPKLPVFLCTQYEDFPGLTEALGCGVMRVINKSQFAKALEEIFNHDYGHADRP